MKKIKTLVLVVIIGIISSAGVTFAAWATNVWNETDDWITDGEVISAQKIAENFEYLKNQGTPSGAVTSFNLTSCPEGWSEYLPARGRFVRGIDSSGVVDPDGTRNVGSLQDGEFESHSHNEHGLRNVAGGWSISYQPYYTYSWYTNGPNDTTLTTEATGGTETRPKNVALLYCEKD